MKKIVFKLFTLVILLGLMVSPAIAQVPDGGVDSWQKGLGEPQPATVDFVQSFPRVDSFIVVLEEPSLVSYRGEIRGLEPPGRTVDGKLDVTDPASVAYLDYVNQVQDDVIQRVETALNRGLEIDFRYDVVLNGFAAAMSAEEAAKLLTLPGVRTVYPNEVWQLNTDVSPFFLGADTVWQGTSTPDGITSTGEGMLVGILDTGINMDHPSFAEVGGDEYEHTNPFGDGVFKGLCETDPDDFICNNKLVGVYAYTQADEILYGEDNHAHGSHTASTAAGNYLEDVEFEGMLISISGMAPHANIIAYDVCHLNGCPNAYSVAAVQQAILDGVDVLNYSIGPNSAVNPYTNPVEIAMLEAMDAGILTSTSAGNDGPNPSTVYKAPPWTIVTANSTHGRIFGFPVEVYETGETPYEAVALPSLGLPFSVDLLDTPIRWAGDDTLANYTGCAAFSTDFFDGAVALISRGGCNFSDKIDNAAAAGALGVLIYNNSGGPPIVMGGTETTTVPSAMLDKEDGDAMVAMASETLLVRVYKDQTPEFKPIWADILAQGSSRGPYALLDILEPEVAAPGTNILAAYNTPGAEAPFGGVGEDAEINLMSGTSMASPHVAGASLLLMDLFPTWTPMQIKSAITMSAKLPMVKDDGVTPVDPFDVGVGRLDLTKASLIGLTMDETMANFQAADPAEGGDVKTLNIPSYQNNQCVGMCSFTRTFTAVVDADYEVIVDAPEGVSIIATPDTFSVVEGAEQEITFDIDVMDAELGDWIFALVTLATTDTFDDESPITDARFPIAIIPDAGNLPGLVRKDVYRDAGGHVLEDLYALEITDLTIETAGLTEAALFEFELAGDPTNDDPFDDLDDVWYTTFTIPPGTKRVVMEILETTAVDLDLFFGLGTEPSAATLWDYAATSGTYEYLSWVDPDPDTWWVLVQNWGGTATPDDVTLALAIVPDDPSTNFEVSGPASVEGLEPFELEITWDEPDMEPLSAWYGWFSVGTDPANPGLVGQTELNLYRPYDDVTKLADPAAAEYEDEVTFALMIAPNRTGKDLYYVLEDELPAGVTYVADSLETTGTFTPAVYDPVTNTVSWEGTVPKIEYTYIVSDNHNNPDYCDTPWGGWLDPLIEFDYGTIPGLEGDSISFAFTTLGAGTEYYGTAIPGTPTFTDDGYFYMYPPEDWWWFVPQEFPDPTLPDGIVAQWMYDTVIQYDAVNNYGVTGINFSYGALWFVNFTGMYDWAEPDNMMDYQIWGWREVDPSVGYPDIVIAFNNVVGDWDEVGSVGLENIDATLGTSYAYMDWVPSTGDIVCFDYAEAGAEPIVITYDVTVDVDVPDTLITNIVNHTADGFGMRQEQAYGYLTVKDLAPVALDQALETEEDVPLPLTLTGENLWPGPVTWMIDTPPANGTLTGTAPDLVYTPDPDWYGVDDFTFYVNEGLQDSNTATITITVTSVNYPPMAVDDYYETEMDTPLDVPAPGVLENDMDPDPGDEQIVDLKRDVEHGTLVLNEDGSFTYTPDPGFFGRDSFEYYLISLPPELRDPQYLDDATVYITVNPPLKYYFPIFMH